MCKCGVFNLSRNCRLPFGIDARRTVRGWALRAALAGRPGAPRRRARSERDAALELASRIARWRTGEPAGADDADARASSGDVQVLVAKLAREKARGAPPPPRATATDAHARVNAVVEARTRRPLRRGHHRQGARLRARRAPSREQRVDRQSARVRGGWSFAALSAPAGSAAALTLIRRGPDGRVAVGSLRRAEATMYENYARSARASAAMGGETGARAAPRRRRRRVHSTRSSASSGGPRTKNARPAPMTREGVPSPRTARGRPPWDASPAKARRRAARRARRPSLVVALAEARSSPSRRATASAASAAGVSSTGSVVPWPRTAPVAVSRSASRRPRAEAEPEPFLASASRQSREPEPRAFCLEEEDEDSEAADPAYAAKRPSPRRTNPRRARRSFCRGAVLRDQSRRRAWNRRACRRAKPTPDPPRDLRMRAGFSPRRARFPRPWVFSGFASPEPQPSRTRSCRSSRSTRWARARAVLRAQPYCGRA